MHNLAPIMARHRTTVSLEGKVINEVVTILGKESRKSISNTIEALLKEAITARKKKKKVK